MLIDDILEASKKILKFTRNSSFDKFILDDKTVDAVIRSFEVIGEATNRLSPEARKVYRNVDWKRIRGFRNRIVHEYFGIDHSIVWNIIQNYLPELVKELKAKPEKRNRKS